MSRPAFKKPLTDLLLLLCCSYPSCLHHTLNLPPPIIDNHHLCMPPHHTPPQVWFYIDVRDVVQGPFSAREMVGWVASGMLKEDTRACGADPAAGVSTASDSGGVGALFGSLFDAAGRVWI